MPSTEMPELWKTPLGIEYATGFFYAFFSTNFMRNKPMIKYNIQAQTEVKFTRFRERQKWKQNYG